MGLEIRQGVSPDLVEKVKSGAITSSKFESYEMFLDTIQNKLLHHSIITDNDYCKWFEEGDLSSDNIRKFLVQFSVFSNLFIEAQLKKVINAPTLESMRASKEILMNELGVNFRKDKSKMEKIEDGYEASTMGSIQGGMFRHAGAHFEWLLQLIPHFDLEFKDVGKRRHGDETTLFFCDELCRIYGSDDPDIALGASFAVENWANKGFWKELISGLKDYKEKNNSKMPLAFFTWHDVVEVQHAAHTWEELEEDYFETDVDNEKFMQGANEILHAVEVFWNGLQKNRTLN
jgi:hypothetical protein